MVILLDSEAEGKMYIKVSDNIGMSSLRIFNYVETTTNATTNVTDNRSLDLSQYVRKDELENIIRKIVNEQSISTTATVPATTTVATNTAVQPKIITVKK
jgi:hypothetical protein